MWITYTENSSDLTSSAGLAASPKRSASGCDQSPTVSEIDSLKVCCLVGWLKDNCHERQFGMTSPHSEEQCCHAWISFMEDSPVRTCQWLAVELGWTESEVDLSATSGDWLMSYDRDSSSWKTSQLSLMEDWIEFSERWPSAGTMRDGYVYPQLNWARAISGIDGGYLPTPMSAQHQGGTCPYKPRCSPCCTPNLEGMAAKGLLPTPTREDRGNCKHRRNGIPSCYPRCDPSIQEMAEMGMLPTPTARDWKDGSAQSCANVPVNGLLGRAIHRLPTVTPSNAARRGENATGGPALEQVLGGPLSPQFVEQMMGYPLEASALLHWATAWFRKSRKKRSVA